MFAQENKKTEQILNEASFIFKGTVVETTRFKGEGEKDSLVSYVVKVRTIYKGEGVILGNITVVTKTDITDKFRTGGVAIFICDKYNNSLSEIPKSKKELCNDIVLKPVCGTPDCYFYYQIHPYNGNFRAYEVIKGFSKTFERYRREINGRFLWDKGRSAFGQLDNYLAGIGITIQEYEIISWNMSHSYGTTECVSSSERLPTTSSKTGSIVCPENKKPEQILKDAAYVFKGTVISYKAFRKENDKKLYASYIIKVETIYKGENKLKKGTIELIYDAPYTWTLSEEWGLMKDKNTHESNDAPFELTNGTSGLFVCDNKNSPSSSAILTSNDFVLTPVCGNYNCFFRYLDGAKNRIKGFNKNFNSWEELDNHFEGIGITRQLDVKKR